MPKGIIISGSAGVGKTTVGKKYKNVIDLDCSDYKWIYKDNDIKNMEKEKRKGIKNRIVNPKWPLNYIKSILENALKYDIVLISQQKELRELLDSKDIDYIVCFPNLDCKDEYISRYRKRGNNEAFVKIQEQNYDKWVSELLDSPHEEIILDKGQYLDNALIDSSIYDLNDY